MPTASFSTLATGARQLVVHEALLTILCSALQPLVIDAVDDGVVGAVGRSRDQDLLRAGAEMARGLLLAREHAGAFEHEVDPEIAPGKLRHVALGQHLDRPLADDP